MCKKFVDAFLSALNFDPDWFVTHEMLKIVDDIDYDFNDDFNDDIDNYFDYIDDGFDNYLDNDYNVYVIDYFELDSLARLNTCGNKYKHCKA